MLGHFSSIFSDFVDLSDGQLIYKIAVAFGWYWSSHNLKYIGISLYAVWYVRIWKPDKCRKRLFQCTDFGWVFKLWSILPPLQIYVASVWKPYHYTRFAYISWYIYQNRWFPDTTISHRLSIGQVLGQPIKLLVQKL